MKKKYFVPKLFLLIILIAFGCDTYGQSTIPPVPFSPRLINGNTNIKIKGDVLMIGNSIMGGVNATNPNPNSPYTGGGNNNSFTGEYIDIDLPSEQTFNSSAATLSTNLPCAKVAYAGLYWSAVYPNERGTNSGSQFIGTPRTEDWNTMKFKVPGGSYVNIVADNNPDPNNDTDANPDDDDDAIVFNGYNYLNINNSFKDAPYVCYKNVTSMLQGRTLDGLYYGANIKATRGIRDGGCAGGWMLVVIYEELTLPSKFISTFDGYVGVQGGGAATQAFYNTNGFETLPAPFPVRAKIGVGALEGDRALGGDQCLFKANTSAVAPFALFSLPENPNNNFFSSTIKNLGVNIPRIPNSSNTLGFDVNMVNIDNPLNQRVPNGETGARITLTTSSDGYGAFFSLFAVDNIEPEIQLIKTVVDSNDTIISGSPLGLDQQFFYKLCFKNVGNDDATNFVITDILPTNIIFPIDGSFNPLDDLVLPPGVTATYIAATKKLTFTIDNSLVQEFDPQYCIKIKVRTPKDCSDVIDACANIATNQAYQFYKNSDGSQIFADPLPSANGLDACNFPTPGATVYLTDIALCTNTREEVLCGNTLVLTAANGFTSYVWTYDHDNNVATAPIPYPGGNTQSITVSTVGTYFVNMITPAPCITLNEIIRVSFFNDAASISNPVIPFADEVAICPNDGTELPKIILCGAADSQLIQTGITSVVGIVWQQLVVGSCPAVTIANCANTNTSCTWNQVGTGANYLANTAGQYRMVITYQNGCFRTFYFNVYKNLLNATVTPTNITCTTPGGVIISGLSADYEYSLSPTGPWQQTSVFTFATPGPKTVYVRQENVVGGCVFPFTFDILLNILNVDVTVTTPNCNGVNGKIQVDVNGVLPQYTFQLLQGATVLSTIGPTNANTYTFANQGPGIYTVKATTDEGCTYSETVTIGPSSDLSLGASVSQNISCTQGNILVNPNGGQSPFDIAIHSYTNPSGVTVFPSPYNFQAANIFDIPIGAQGTYVFIVVDNNNCTAFSNPVTIDLEPPVSISEIHTNVTCNGLNNGTITMSTGPLNGYNATYNINGGVLPVSTTFTASNVFTSLAPGTYTIIVKFKKGNRECTYPITVVITQPQPLIGASELVQQKTCLVNGTIQAINISGGTVTATSPYTYSINGTTFQTSPIFANLGPGFYTIIIKDANGCTFPTLPQQITDAVAPTSLTFSNSAITCPTLTTTLTATVVGGTAPYVFQIIAPSTINATTTTGGTATFAGLVNGINYTVRVTDFKGCIITNNAQIPAVTPITLSGNTTSNVQCFGTASGTALLTVGAYATTYSYTINNGTPITAQTANTINLTNLASGTYNVEVTDSQTNCKATIQIIIAQPVAALQLSAPFTPKTCIANGSLNASITGGWGSPQYTLTQPDNTTVGPQASGVFTNLSQNGSYTITVVDANNCSDSETFSLSTSANPDLNLSPSSILCITNTANASLTMVATGGTGIYQYQIQLNAGAFGNLQNSPTFPNLIAGTYTIKVVDSFGCEDTVSQVISPKLTAVASLPKSLDCTTSPNAIISVLISGGLAPYQYQVKFNSGALGALSAVTTNPFTYPTAIAGDYQFLITDAQGCVFQTNEIRVDAISNPVILSVTQVQPTCFGFANGSMTVNLDPNFGTGPFEYNINGGTYQSSAVFQNYPAGTYTLGVRDSKNCVDTEVIVLGQPLQLVGQSQLVQQITCTVTTGTIQATGVSGGTAPYQYSINGGNFGTNPVFTGLPAGDYIITIKDDKGCTITTTMIPLRVPLSPTDITLTSSTITCPSLITNITATAVGGTSPYTYQVTFPSVIIPTSVTGNMATFSNLPITSTSTFTVKVTDANGCEYIKNITVAPIANIAVVGTLNSNVTCLNDTDGQITFTVSNFSTNYSYTINAGSVVNNQTNSQIVLTSLAAGIYNILVTDLVTNCTDTASVEVFAPAAALVLTAPVTQPTCSVNGSVNASATGGWSGYQFTLTYPNATTLTQDSGLFANLLNGAYTISVTDANGCSKSDSFTLNAYTNPELAIDATNSVLCYTTSSNATIAVTGSNGTPNYQYQIQLNADPFGALQGSPIFANLSPGNYTIRVIDNFGCEDTVSQVILPQLIAEATLTKGLDCSINPDANISLNISGGVAPYQYQVNINNAGYGPITAITIPFTTNTAGNYQFKITDSAGCTFETGIIPVLAITNPLITALTQTTPILCKGDTTATISTTIDTSLGLGTYQYSIDGTTFQDSEIFTSLAAGTYTITVRDSNQCTDTETIIIGQPALLAFNVTKTDLTCTGSSTELGSITISNVVGGTQALTYNIRNITFGLIQTFSPPTNENHTFGNIDFGNYIVEVIDVNGCSKTFPISIASPINSLIVANATANCSTGATVDVSVVAFIPGNNYEFGILNSGNSPYVVLPNVFQGPNIAGGVTSTFTNLVPGLAYTFVVRDNTSGCYFIQDVPTQILPSSTVTTNLDVIQNVSCTGSGDGNVSFTLNNFDAATTSVSYTIYQTVTNTPTIYSSSSPVTGPTTPVIVPNFGTLPFGEYYIVITENGGCTTTSPPFSILESTLELEVTATGTNDNCNPLAGLVIASGQFGTPPYNYIIQDLITAAPLANDLDWALANSFTVDSGNYIVYIKDANNCIKQTSTVVVGLDSSPDITGVVVTSPCANEGAFQITVNTNISVGIAPFTYQVNNGVSFIENAANFTVSNLSSGINQEIKITDFNGCTDIFQFTINQNLSGTAVIVDQPTCVPATSGSIRVTAANGSGNYTFVLNTDPVTTPTTITNGTNTATFLNLVHGSYTVTIDDGNCSIPFPIVLEEPNPVDFTINQQNPSCDGDTNGVIEAILLPTNDNNPDYTYVLTAPGFTTITQTNNGLFNVGLGEKTYTLTVTSGRGCEKTEIINLSDPDPLVASDPNTYTFTCTNLGIITINGLTVTGGNGGYQYSLNNNDFFPLTNPSNIVIADNGLPQTITVNIKDSKGCTTSFVYNFTPKAIISNPTIFLDPLLKLSCISNEIIEISFTGNPLGNYTYQLLPIMPGDVATAFTGTTFTPASLTSAGQYTYQIIDLSTGCELLATHTVNPYPVTSVTAQQTRAVACFGNATGQLSFSIQNYTGSYDYEVFTSPGNVSILSGTSSLSPFITPAALAAGDYYVKIKQNAFPFCEKTSPVVTITAPSAAVSVQLTATNDRNCLTNTGTILAVAANGTGPYTYQLSYAGGNIIEPFPAQDNYFENLANVAYTVSVRDANGCPTSDNVTIGLDPTPEIDLELVAPCAAEGQFEIEVTRTVDGIAPYTYVIDTNAAIPIYTTPFVISNLSSGLHNVTITDANGCSFPTQTLTILPVLSGSITNKVQPSCDNNDGIIDADATNGSGLGFTYILQNNLGATIGGPNGDGLFTGLGFGDYTLVITDNDPNIACSIALNNLNLEQPAPVTYTLDIDQPNCNVANGGTANGSITVLLDSGNTNIPYSYTLSDGTTTTTQNNGVFTGLAGSASGITYTVTVESDRGCKKIETAILTTPTPITVAPIAVGTFACTPSNTPTIITITVPTPSGGTAPYLYSFDGTNFSDDNTFDVVDDGTTHDITVTLRDANSCELEIVLPTIQPLKKVNATVVQISALTCDPAGEIVRIVITGDPGHSYTYQLLPSTTAINVVTNPFDVALPSSGNYNFLIVDTTTGCSVITETYRINALNVFTVAANPLSAVTCFGGNNGTMSFTVSGYSGNFSYDVIDSSGTVVFNDVASNTNTPTLVSGLEADSYTISVSIPTSNAYDNCTKISNSITIATPTELLFIAQTASVTCNPIPQGIITVTSTSGGSGSYQYQLVNMPSGTVVGTYSFSSTSVFTDLPSGAYKVIVRDTNATICEANQLITLNPETFITASYNITNQNLACFGDNNASLTVTNAIGGQGTYQYALTYPNGTIAGPQQGSTFTGLSAGVGYYITVSDGWNCDVTLTPFNITQPTPIQATLSLERALTCDVTPRVKITASGGTAPYFVNGQSFNSSIILDVTMPVIGNGIFQYLVTDSRNCGPKLTNQVVIEPIEPIVIELQDTTISIACANEDNAVIIVTNTTGGLGNYSYQLQNAAGGNVGLANSNGVFNNIVGSLIPGETYFVKVTSGDCEQLSAAILVTEPQSLSAPSVVVKNVSCAGKKDGEITVTISGGIQPYQFAISPNLNQTVDPTNPNTVVLSNLGAGTFTILYQDANGCFDTISRNIIEPTALSNNPPLVVSPKCDDDSGSVSVTAIGGTAPYQFSFGNNSNYISNGTNTYTNTTGIFGGETYDVFIKDFMGCETNVTIITQPSVDLSSTIDLIPNCDTQNYILNVAINNNLLATTQFSLDSPNNYQPFGQNQFTNVAPGNHVVYIKNSNGCIKQTQLIDADPFVVLNLTASETGLNQITAVATGGNGPYTFEFNGNNTGSSNVYIFNSTGLQTVTVSDINGCERTVRIPGTFYEIEIPNYFTPDLGWTPENIDNFKDLFTKVFDRYGREVAILRSGERWNGEYRGNPLPSGDYWYIVEVKDGTGRTFVGNVTLYR